jgi:hypothetical protein
MTTNFQKGDIVVTYLWPGVEREILERHEDYYIWCYPELPKDENNIFDSRNSTDPELVMWKLKNNGNG